MSQESLIDFGVIKIIRGQILHLVSCRDKGFDYVFLSTDKTPKHLQRWSQQANQHDHGWLMLDEKVNVTPNSIQWIVYKNLTDTKESFPL